MFGAWKEKYDMGRLTKVMHCDNGSTLYDYSNEAVKNIKDFSPRLHSALAKLAEYEDLEEQGRLLKLPCNAVYYIVDKNNPKYAAVMSKTIRDLTIDEIEKINVDGRYFSTKELAEAKLKELRGEENEM